ncbi:hypothetical protein AB1Y20_012716 [Prymnesium parvum]|uniref:SAC3/GANP/THP3 conserved domain-containing protein n=1 Tax=Prymnesium parvum TaxID=97485 RepID=A0AB34IKL7_PRYPA
MCSEREMREREACLELSRLEMLRGDEKERRPRANPSLVVKRYKRPAAGDAPPPRSELRPLHVLQRTAEHLLRLWESRTDQPPLYRYLFISDRLRAVQQDITVQGIGPAAAPLLGMCVRFHLLMEVEFFDLRDASEQGYSAVQNRSLLCNALISALEFTTALPEALFSELLAYLVLLHADNPAVFTQEIVRAPVEVLSSAPVKQALRLASAISRKDMVDVSRVLHNASLLVIASVIRFFPEMQTLVLSQCNAAYNARELFPCQVLAQRLFLKSPSSASSCAIDHNLKVEGVTGPGDMRSEEGSSAEALPINVGLEASAAAGPGVRFKSNALVRREAINQISLGTYVFDVLGEWRRTFPKLPGEGEMEEGVGASVSAHSEWAWRLMSVSMDAL